MDQIGQSSLGVYSIKKSNTSRPKTHPASTIFQEVENAYRAYLRKVIREIFVDPENSLNHQKHGYPFLLNWAGVLCFNTTLYDNYLHVREPLLLNLNLSGTLGDHLPEKYKESLSFSMRLRIALDSTKGICYNPNSRTHPKRLV
ncbi:hypothetical protein L1987_65533 [Smallanthus sonchifolius]|uniref:Uncharacterized protein n=1 Tax=Smallanthus sonchifolius TaxID=185202 RepID=A0ACB9BUQ6_9ASTR|nr:hypothetical protein L1987_65533 [Smallanthus sonchifolius]